MTTLIGILLLLAASAVAVWFASAFLLHWHQDARCAVTMLIPAAIATALMLRFFLGGRNGADVEPGWCVVFLAVSLFQGALAGVVALPIWLALEQKYGWRAR